MERRTMDVARWKQAIGGLSLSAAPALAMADTIDTGDTAWLLTSTALVLFMTIPGPALFYGGLVRAKNVLSVLMQCFAITCLVTLLWLACGYSLAFATAAPLMRGSAALKRRFSLGLAGSRFIPGKPFRKLYSLCFS